MRRTTMLTATMLTAIVAVMLVATACGGGGASATGQPHQTVSNPAGGSAHPSGPETNPAGDIPDTTVFVPYTDTPGQFTVNVPQGWARTQQGSAVVFTDKLNSVRLDADPAGSAPTVASA